MAVKTKYALLNALLEFVQDNELEKITVTDLVEKCDISRQTFYYHFDDLYQLYSWAFESEIDKILSHAIYNNDWTKVICQFVKFLKKYSVLLKRATESTYCTFFFQLSYNSMLRILNCFIDNHPEIKQNYKRDLDFDVKFIAHACTGSAMTMIQDNNFDFENLAISASKFLYDHFKNNLK